MEEFVSVSVIFLVGAVVANTVLGWLVFRSNTASATNRLYAALSTVISLWLAANFISVHPLFLSSSLAWVQASFLLATMLNVLFFLFSATIPAETIRFSRRSLWLVGLATSAVLLILLSTLAFTGIEIRNGSPNPLFGPGLAAFGIFSIALNIAAVLELVHAVRRRAGEERRQLLLVLWGVLLMFGLIITTIFIPVAAFGVHLFVPFLPLYTLIFLGLTAYAIVKHSLFNIKVIATEALVVILWITLFSKIFFSRSAVERSVDSTIFIVAVFFGYALIRSVMREVRSREQLQELNEMKSNFVSIASHQLRAPIGGVRGYLSMIRDGDYGHVNSKLRGLMELNMTALDHTLRVIEMFLDVTKMEAGKIELNRKPTNLLAVVADVEHELSDSAQRKGLRFATKLPKTLPTLYLDAEKMRNVIFNLVENAIKYTESGRITLAVRKNKNSVECSVTDTGIGVASDEVSKLFAKFVRAGGGFKVSHGSGLGLYIIKTLVEAHGGTVFVQSQGENKGSTFGFRLPITTR